MTAPKKLIEVALPLEAINRESAREKSIRHGHPSTLHLWWARRPLAACRAVLFAQLVDDPSSHPEEFPTEEAQEQERQRLFTILEELVKWENSNNQRVLEAARAEIRKSTGGNPPPVLDPFCGGGSIPLEAQRLGLEAHASDLNPVAVLITKALIEIPPKFAGRPPVHLGAPASRRHSPLGWYSRGYVPHFDQPGLVQMLTFRLHDALPAAKRQEWEALLNLTDEAVRRQKIEAYLDAGYGSCSLRDGRIARLVEDALHYFDGQRYRLLAWVIMPNHVHVLIETLPGHPVAEVVHAWKSFTAKKANAVLGRTGAFWQRDYFDRFIRDERHLENTIHYMHYNPVKAGLVERAEEWSYSSAAHGARYGASETLALPGMAPEWSGARGLAEDVRFYGQWMRHEAEKRIGHLYPKVRLPTAGSAGVPPAEQEATVIAWLWARTVTCPNPACGARMPLVRSFALSTKKGKKAWVVPIVDRVKKTVRFAVRAGEGAPPEGTKVGRGAKFCCLVCNHIADDQHIKKEGSIGRIGTQLMAIVAEGNRSRVYLSPTPEHEEVVPAAKSSWVPEGPLAYDPRNIWCRDYGLTTFADLFTPRQLVALTTFSDLVGEARERVRCDAIAVGLPDDGIPLAQGGAGAQAYADAVATYLALAVDRLADRSSTICSWDAGYVKVRNTFARQAIPMTWDFAEANPLSSSTGNFLGAVEWITEVIRGTPCTTRGGAKQLDAASAINGVERPLVSTDPPYYDNIGYADLSDFFYVWLRRPLGEIYPSLFSTLLTPKSQELIATPYRFDGDRSKARAFFEQGLGEAFRHMRQAQHVDFPLALFYAFKQSESESDGDRVSTGWETMLAGLLASGFAVTGTWPVRSELSNRTVARATNALASSIVLVCRPRPQNASRTTRREFLSALKRELPQAVRTLQHGNIAPVDLAQAAIGPGMAIFSRYAAVLEADGAPMRIRMALSLINQVLDEILAEQEGEFDPDTRWALAWFEQFGQETAPFGEAETLSKAKNTSVPGLVEAGILEARGGRVRLLKRQELNNGWDPSNDARLTVWEVTQHLIRTLEHDGEAGAAAVLGKVGVVGEAARDLAYRLYGICERKKWAQEALAYNSLVIAWPEIARLAASDSGAADQQAQLFA